MGRLRGHQKLSLMYDLANGDHSQTELGEKYGISQGRISQFVKENADEIQEMIDEIENEYAGMWIADKRKRLAEMQDDIDALSAVIDTNPDPKLIRVKLAALRAAAEELGQLTQNVNVGGITYKIEGVGLGNLT